VQHVLRHRVRDQVRGEVLDQLRGGLQGGGLRLPQGLQVRADTQGALQVSPGAGRADKARYYCKYVNFFTVNYVMTRICIKFDFVYVIFC
jgi:hypothetical protein